MKIKTALLSGSCLVFLLTGCASGPDRQTGTTATAPTSSVDKVLEQEFVFNVLTYIYRWHFDQSYVLEAGKQDTLDVWARILTPALDEGDRSEFGELWIPAVKTRVDLKRSDYHVPELSLQVRDRDFKVKRVSRQVRPPTARSHYKVRSYALAEVQDYLFAKRSDRAPIANRVRQAGRDLIIGFLAKEHPGEFMEAQTFHIAPVSSVCNDCWVFWETGRKVMMFSADMDLSNAGASALSQLKLQVIDLDKDVVASSKEVPGSNAFVTKDWVGRLFFNCILFGERVVWTPEQIKLIRASHGPH